MAAFKPSDFEVLALEVHEQFAWAVDEGELNPESVALFVEGKLISGHTRTRRHSLRTTAIIDAQHYFEDQFHAAAQGLVLPATILMKTKIREDGVTPRQPSSAFLRDLRALAKDQQVEIIVLGPPEHKGLILTINGTGPAPA
jgi:hypothetical protein